MPYQRLKSDSYQAMGGINQKTSQADLSIMEFLDISNLDFNVSGALTQRQGTATFLLSTVVNQTLSISAGTPSFLLTGASILISPASSTYEFSNLAGSSFIMFSQEGYFNYNLVFGLGSLMQMYYATGSSFNYLLDPATKVVNFFSSDFPVNPNFSFTSFVNRLFFSNGDHFYKWSGSTTVMTITNLGVAGGSIIANNVWKYNLPVGATCIALNFIGTTAAAWTSATYTYSWGFINERGYHGPVTSPFTISGIGVSTSEIDVFGYSALAANGFSVPDAYGIIGVSQITSYVGISGLNAAAVAVYRDNGPGTGRFRIGYAPISPSAPNLALRFADTFLPTSTFPEPTAIFATLPPQYLEIYNNQMFMCGFSQAPSTVQFSDIGEPESVQPQNNFDVRTNDGDVLTGMRSAFSQLFFFKNKSFHVLQGDNPENFVLSPLSDQYGCISNRAVAVYQNYLMFLDKKGIALYNGSQVAIASSKIDPIFAKMNIPAAQSNAWMVHNKIRNQIWTGIPVNGSTLINRVVIYDYLLNAWTHFDGLNLASAAIAFGAQAQPTVYWGGYSGFMAYFGSSNISDMGATIQMSAQTRFISDMGQSVEKMWRRLFMNVISSQGATSVWSIALFANYASLPSITFSQGGISFQSRTDFGVSAKALSVQFSTATNTDTLQLQGFTIESRFQRNQ